MSGTDPIARLMLELGRLPGIGERSAARLAYHIIRISRRHPETSLARDLAAALCEADAKVGLCAQCQNLCADGLCSICADPRRHLHTLCLVESVSDLRAIEQSRTYFGRYHVLHGAISPLDGVGPEELKIDLLLARLADSSVEELILATNANVQGDATALYISQVVAPELKITRLASGIPLGGELEYLDGATLGRALSERRAFRAEI